ncbi:hypothetical protein LTR66_002558 [Elasticomyces elasticus]|nr:hypothetical protein LTR28_009927 [Elasticomyces elasticus]KAK4998182.1 hypothetical protein LTR66_002558 [Elasticomyces elasticus]
MDSNNSLSDRALPVRSPSTSTLPPWELLSLPRVPYLDPSSTPLSDAEKRDLPSLWATRLSTASSARPKLGTDAPSGPCSLSPIFPTSRSFPRNATDDFAPSLPPALTSHAHPSLTTRATAPQSESTTSASSTTVTSPQNKGISGTMSGRTSRKRSDGRNQTQSISKEGCRRKASPELEIAPLASRMKTAFKDVFKRDPIDESRFERIESRHWTDD